MQIFGFDIGFCVVNGVGVVFYCDYFIVQIFDIFDVVIISVDYYQQVVFIVVVGEVDCFFMFVGNGDFCQCQIDIFGLQCWDNVVEVYWFQGVVEFQFFGDSCLQVNVKIYIFIVLFKFEWDECCIGGDNQGFISGMGRNCKSQGQCSQ